MLPKLELCTENLVLFSPGHIIASAGHHFLKLCAVKAGVTLCHGVPEKPHRQGSGQGPRAGLTVSVKPSALDHLPTGKGSSKFRGVSWHKDNMKWRATIFKGESIADSCLLLGIQTVSFVET